MLTRLSMSAFLLTAVVAGVACQGNLETFPSVRGDAPTATGPLPGAPTRTAITSSFDENASAPLPTSLTTATSSPLNITTAVAANTTRIGMSTSLSTTTALGTPSGGAAASTTSASSAGRTAGRQVLGVSVGVIVGLGGGWLMLGGY